MIFIYGYYFSEQYFFFINDNINYELIILLNIYNLNLINNIDSTLIIK